MSLEAALKENTETMRELIEVLTRTNLPEAQAAAGKAAKTKPAAEAEDADKPAFLKGKAAAKPAAAAAEKPAAAKPAPAKAAKSDDAYAPVKAAILKAIADGHRKSITDMLAEYDAKTGQDLDPSVYDEVLEKISVINGGEVEGELA